MRIIERGNTAPKFTWRRPILRLDGWLDFVLFFGVVCPVVSAVASWVVGFVVRCFS